MFNFERKIIFLDVDGVLNSTRSCVAFGGYGSIYKESSWGDTLDMVAIKLLQRIVKQSGAKVVLSSTWRIGAKEGQLGRFGEFLGVDIIDRTTVTDRGTRGEEIQLWLDSNKNVTHFVILDDDSNMLESQLNNFVKTDRHVGIGFEDYKKACVILCCDD